MHADRVRLIDFDDADARVLRAGGDDVVEVELGVRALRYGEGGVPDRGAVRVVAVVGRAEPRRRGVVVDVEVDVAGAADKIAVIENLIKSADAILIGGAMAYTFLKSQGIETGRSLVEDDKVDLAATLLSQARERAVSLMLPPDNVVVDKSAWDSDPRSTKPRVCSVTEIEPQEAGLDIGPVSIAEFSDKLRSAKTIVWNGPMGMFEHAPFDAGTRAIAQAVAESEAISIVGGGDSVAAITEAGVADHITHVSTGGGASLEFLAGETLPGVAALTDK